MKIVDERQSVFGWNLNVKFVTVKEFVVNKKLTVDSVFNLEAMSVWRQAIDKLFDKLFNNEILFLHYIR